MLALWRVRGGRKPAPISAQRNVGHPDLSPPPSSCTSLPDAGMSGSRVQDDGGVGGGSGGRGLGSRSRATTLGLLNRKPSTNPTIPPSFPGIAPTIRPHIRGGGGRSWEGGGDGWVNGRLNPPIPFPHPCCLPCSPPTCVFVVEAGK